ncbi:MAG: NHL repeat-containing protein [Cellvibrionaceae bacterium]
MTITFDQYYGEFYKDATGPFPKRVTDEFTFNSPVGTAMDQYQRIWVADTGNNRIVVFDKDFSHMLAVYFSDIDPFAEIDMPFRIACHPTKPWLYITCIGNHLVYVVEYDEDLNVSKVAEFGGAEISSPNGIALAEKDGEVTVFVADEFYHDSPDGMSRIVKFDEMGNLLGTIDSVKDGNKKIKILWPQGIDTDDDGNLYIANTGFTSVIRCDKDGKGVKFPATGSAQITGFKIPRGVSVINNKIYVPDSTTNYVNIYDMKGEFESHIVGFIAPIQVSPGAESDEIIVTNPITPNVDICNVDETPVLGFQVADIRHSVGGPRNQPGQLHFVSTAVPMSLTGPDAEPQHEDNAPTTPASFMLEMFTDALRIQWDFWTSLNPFAPSTPKGEFIWNANPGQYQIMRWKSTNDDYLKPKNMMLPPFAGGLSIDYYTPAESVPFQLASGTPLVFVSNFFTGTVNIYQYSEYLDELVFYGFFGGLGILPDQMVEPLGIEINKKTGEIYVADSHNNRISKWTFNEDLGTAVFDKVWGEVGDADGQFRAPSDVAIDNDGNVYVTDQFNNRVQVFTADGEFLYTFGQQGYGADSDNFLLPDSLAIADSHIFVNDLVNRAIKMFTLDGQFISSFSSLSGKPDSGGLWMPYFLSVDDGKIRVPDCTLNKVNIYDYEIPSAS